MATDRFRESRTRTTTGIQRATAIELSRSILSVLETFAKLYDEPGYATHRGQVSGRTHSRPSWSTSSTGCTPDLLGRRRARLLHFHRLERNQRPERRHDLPARRHSLQTPQDVILSGPHYFCGNPFYKTARRNYSKNSDYDVLELTTLTEDYIPRTNYRRACSTAEYERRTPRVPWIEPNERHPRRVTDYYRVVNRAMDGWSHARTHFQTALLPPGTSHVHTNLL